MRVLVTGANGFIGSRVVRELVRGGDEVGALVRSGADLTRLADVRESIALLEGSLEDRASLADALRFAPDACIHLAWYAEPGQYLTSRRNIEYLASSLSLLEALADAGCAHVTVAGSCTEYDTSVGWLREDGPAAPETLYAACKLALGIAARQFAKDAGMSLAWARLFYLYGPYEDARRLVPAAVRALLSGQPFASTPGEQVRDYLHVDDAARALVTLSRRRADGTFNVASGVPLTVRALLETIAETVGRGDLLQLGSLPYREWEPMFICGDNERLRSLGWAPEYDLQRGIAEVCDWWRSRLEYATKCD